MGKKMTEQTLEEFKKEIFEQAKMYYLDHKTLSIEETLEYVFRQAHVRGQWAASKGIVEL